MYKRELALHGRNALDFDEFAKLLDSMISYDEIVRAAWPDYVKCFERVLSRRIGFKIGLRYMPHSRGPLASIPAASVQRLLRGEAPNERSGGGRRYSKTNLRADGGRAIEAWSESEICALLDEILEPEDEAVILDYLASSTDALCCDVLLDLRTFEQSATRIREIKRFENVTPVLKGRLTLHSDARVPLASAIDRAGAP